MKTKTYFQQIVTSLNDNKTYLLPYLIVWVMGLLVVLLFDKIDIHQVTNQRTCAIGDAFFPIVTKLGETFPFIVGGSILLFHLRKALFVLSVQVVGAIAVYLLKSLFRAPRPRIVFQELGLDLHTIDGVRLHAWNSFPSGHTMTAFAFFLSLALIVKNQLLKFFFFAMSLLVGFSRIYLNQHFLEDTLAGSFLAVVIVLIMYPFFNTQQIWGNKGLMSLVKKSTK
jgi:membrane-associated phospholipid phosphatase